MDSETDFARLCRALNLTIAEAARRMGVPYLTAHRWHQGKSKPSRMAQERIERLRQEAS